MRTLRLLAFLSFACAGVHVVHAQQPPATPTDATPAGIPGTGLAGHWQGALRATPVVTLRLALEIATAPDGTTTGTMISLDQGNARIPLTAIAVKDDGVHVEAARIGGTFDGTFNADGSELAGQWRQGGATLPLTFRRVAAAPNLTRRQDPVPPYPYVAEDVTFANATAGLTLAGTFTRPNGDGPHPAVVLISGSGPQDRDEALMGHRPFLVLADHLTRQGIAVLRYDDRGIGRSTGNFAAATHDDFVTDALAAVAWLKTQPRIDPDRIGLVGHSEGGLAAPLAVVARPGDIAFMVLLAGPGVPTRELLARQSADMARVMGASPELIAQSAAAQERTFDVLTEDVDAATLERRLRALAAEQMAQLTDEQRKAFGYTDAGVENQLRMVMTPWFRHLLAYDPGPTLRQVTIPVLAINGGKDLQVAAEPNLAGIAAGLAAAGNTDVTTWVFPALNHLFQTATTGAMVEYGTIEETFNPDALAAISTWIRQRSGLN